MRGFLESELEISKIGFWLSKEGYFKQDYWLTAKWTAVFLHYILLYMYFIYYIVTETGVITMFDPN